MESIAVLWKTPTLAGNAFFHTTALREAVLAEQPPATPDPENAWQALERGANTRAERQFRENLVVNDSQGHYGWGLALLGDSGGDPAQ